jgi:tRNA U55 pseudouridine synthase TruB
MTWGRSWGAAPVSRYGPFDIKDAITPEQLQENVKSNDWQQLLNPVDCVLFDLPKIDVDEDTVQAIKNGRVLSSDNLTIDSALHDCCRAYDGEGHFLAVLRFNSEEGRWQAEKVFPQK